MDRLDCIKTFTVVVKQGNFSLAAKEMNISRDLVAKRIAYLEHHLQASLFLRTTRKMNLTTTGEKFYQHSLIILSEYEWAKQEISHDHFYPEGELKINAPLSFTENVLTPFFSEFIHLYPNIKITLSLTDSFIDIYENQHDLTLRVDESPIDAFENIIISKHMRQFYASPEYFKKQGKPNILRDLRSHQVLAYNHSSSPNKIEVEHNGEMIYKHLFPKFACNNGAMLIDLALAHHGIIYLPDFLVKQYVASGQLEACLQDYIAKPLYFYVACPSRQKIAKKSLTFINFICNKFNATKTY